ncbi:M3 family metallopeptidase [Allopusillimonas ginsengisoli]|uniref:M3 family metallopeptidase n=1 Tax=Allopusillimonas ginsengisoli TaxID=453575 RepID=UPI00101EF800|nr:M3 family metallopeptidase [Allopusillimonas ginsengisoli]TEA77660.1 M3 family peptidase [Allopusillimonas ginsengisoli]
MSQNPLTAPVTQLIDYAAVKPAHIEPAVTMLIAEARQAVERAADPTLPTRWEAIVEPLEDASGRLWRAWSVAGHLNAVVNTPELRSAYNACLPLVTEFSTWVGLHEGLFAQYKRLKASQDYADLTPVRQRIVDLALRDFRLSGVALQGSQRKRYAEISDQEAQASQKFSEHVLDTVDQWALMITDEQRLEGIPADVRQAARSAAEADGKPGWKLVLKMPCYLPVMQRALDRSLRQEMYKAYATIASEQGSPELDNSALIEQLLALRAEEAHLLGYDSFAALRLETRMADSAQQVTDFLRELAAKAKPYAQRDLAELRAFARDTLHMPELEPWDIAFVSERLREARYAYSEEEIKQYFTEPQVLDGLFHVMNRLFNITLRRSDAPTWHKDAQALEVLSAKGDVLGVLYIDLYARQGKQGGAWVDSERSRRRSAAGLQTPVAYLTCNFSAPQDGKPALLTHDDVITLFHESGHAMHTLLSQIDDPGAAAFASVEWDAIELPSQFMENFCYEWPVLRSLSSHVESGAHLPRALFDKLVAARNFQSGMQMLRQVEFALFDMVIHHQPKGMSIEQVLATLDDVRKEVAVLFPPSWHRFPHAFSHLFAGGYGAGYYSYKWAEVLSADAYAAFEEAVQCMPDSERDTLHPGTGQRFLQEILAIGGARPAADSFKAFRGRAPSLEPLLRHSGLAESSL